MLYAVVYSPFITDRATLLAHRAALRAWRTSPGVDASYRVASHKGADQARGALLVRASPEALARLPAAATWNEWRLPAPRPYLAAFVRDVGLGHPAASVRGTTHFAPGTLVLVGRNWSGDGGERVWLLGRDRETGRYARMLGPTARLKRWHRTVVTHPKALYALGFTPGGQWNEEQPVPSGFPAEPPPIAWQPEDEWAALVSHASRPARAALASCAAAVLGCDASEVERWIADDSLGPRLTDAQKGRHRPRAGVAVVGAAAAAWELVAPRAWLADDPARAFARPDLVADSHGAIVATRSRPRCMRDAVTIAASADIVPTAEALGEAVAVALPGASRSSRRAVWHFTSRNRVAGFPDFDPIDRYVTRQPLVPPGPTDTRSPAMSALYALTHAVLNDDDVAAAHFVAALRAHGPHDPAAPLLDLLRLGFRLVHANDRDVHLVCPELPSVRRAGSKQHDDPTP